MSNITNNKQGILVVDYGSQYTLLIVRRLREIGVYAEICDSSVSSIDYFNFKIEGIILSGGPDSVLSAGARSLPSWVIKLEKPILGICYGMQLLIEYFGGQVRQGIKREYGKTLVYVHNDKIDMLAFAKQLFINIPSKQQVWMSHGDDVSTLSSDFETVAISEDNVIAAIAHKTLPIIGLQFHPEVYHTQYGINILANFAKNICGICNSWTENQMLDEIIRRVQIEAHNGKILMAVSGGVDSTVCCAVVAKAIGAENVYAVFVDHGLLRKNEVLEVENNLKQIGIKNLVILNKAEIFLSRLKNVVDPEQKRKIIGHTFIEVFEDFARNSNIAFTHLAQGTLYPDIIESAAYGHGSKKIKSHHNVGGLPEKLNLKLLEPFKFLFKDEVRKIAYALNLPSFVIRRHPFPGPGLAVRIIGEIDEEKIRILQQADYIYIEELKKQGLYDSIWQAFCVLLPVKSVGVMGDDRTYEYVAVLRAVCSTDGMTADVSEIDINILKNIASLIIRKVKGINRVCYDITTKPPATIEWE